MSFIERSDMPFCCGQYNLNMKRLAQTLVLAGVVACMVFLYQSEPVMHYFVELGRQGRAYLHVSRQIDLNYTALDEVFISVKTTHKNHRLRLPVIIKTWFQLAKRQTWFFTDSDDVELQQKTDGRMVNTKCPPSHSMNDLCCKMSVEFDTFVKSGNKWFCHVDDDNYVNIPRLVRFLADYSPQEDWYLGKRAPLKLLKNPAMRGITYKFATGGAGFCLSQALALKMVPMIGDGKFVSICKKLELPDDVTMGYVVERLMRTPLTVIDQFHSHLEPMNVVQNNTFHEQITFSYRNENVVNIDGYEKQIDQTRFLSIHCFLFPHFDFCPN
ncbi:fringe glycosyltransferase [Anabrus simplex]|uniref:fringe glycosyltransferase n=1 Tax=Anabrus simplex TaxID=316456 RepID=UPI0035A37F92